MAAGRISPSCETSKLEDSSMERYSPWREVAGCFDGDGSACVSIMKYVLKVRLCFYDVWRPQLEAIKTFFEWKGVSTRSLAVRHKKLGDIWYLTISDAESIDAIARKILPFSCKNRGDLLVALDYRDDKITAEQAVAKLNESVHDKRRSG